MIMHIGNNISLYKNEIIGIFDYKIIENCQETKKNIKSLKHENFSNNKIEDETKSYILVSNKNSRSRNIKYQVYTSSISAKSLFRRKNNCNNRLEECKCPMK